MSLYRRSNTGPWWYRFEVAASSTALPPALGIAEKLRRQSDELAQRSKQTSSPAPAGE